MKYVNTSSETRRWTGIQRPDGRGLELGPGETVELDCEVSDPFLAPVETKRKRGAKPAADKQKGADPTDPGEPPDDTAPDKAPQSTDQPGEDAPAEE